MSDDSFLDHLTNAIHADLFEPWREIDAQITTFCQCSLTLVGSCSIKNNRGRSIRRRVRRSTSGSKSNDPDGDGGPGSGPRSKTLDQLNSRRASL